MIQKGNIVLGIGKQADKDTIAAAPSFAFGVESGGLKLDPEHEALELTSNVRAHYGAKRTKMAEGAAFTTAAYAGSIGALLMAVLGSVETTGTTAPYSHVFSMGDTLPWYTLFEKVSDAIFAVAGNKVKSVEFSWTENKPLMVSVEADGLVFSTPVAFGPVNDELGSIAYLMPVGGAFAYAVASGTPATAPVKGGSVKFTNANEDPDFFSGSIEAGDICEGRHSVDVTLTIRPADLDDWMTGLTGAADGTTATPEIVTGSFSVKFVAGDDSLQFDGTAVDFLYAEAPQGDGKMGPWEVDLAGTCYMPESGDAPVTATLVNTIAAY
jgi:hypothetical protein